MKSPHRQRLLLVVIAVIAIAMTWQLQPQQPVRGQDSALPTSPPPTPFPTWTPAPPGLPVPPGLPTIAPTPTPDMRTINQIFSPKAGDAVSGFAAIVGSALIDNFAEYQVHISPAGMENWTWLQTSRKPIRANLIYALNTYLLQDGFYDLRIRAIRDDGNYTETFLRGFEVRNANPPTPTPVFDALGTPQPASPLIPLPNLQPTVTPTPRVQAFVNNGQGIYRPQNGDVVRGLTPIVGTVNGKTNLNPFARFELAIAPNGTDEWEWLYTGERQYWQSPIYQWNTRQVSDGLYDLRLRIVYSDSNYDEYYVTKVRVANDTFGELLPEDARTSAGEKALGLYLPRDGAQVTGLVEFVGATAIPDLLQWELYWSPAGAESWEFLVADTKPVVNGTLARLDLSLLPTGSYDFRLRLVHNNYTYDDFVVHNVQVTQPTPTPIPLTPPR